MAVLQEDSHDYTSNSFLPMLEVVIMSPPRSHYNCPYYSLGIACLRRRPKGPGMQFFSKASKGQSIMLASLEYRQYLMVTSLD
jgi:hypothetical protein